MSSVEWRDPATVIQLLQQNSLPFEVEVVTGFVDDQGDGERSCLHPGTLFRVHYVLYETMFVGETEGSREKFNLFLDNANRIELLPEIPELDDRVFATVRDLLEAVPRPKWVRVQESYDGGNDHNTVHEGEEFQDLYTGKYRGESCMCGRVVGSKGKEGETSEVCLTLDTMAMFTTTRSVNAFLTAADLAAKCEVGDEVMIRVRVHSVKKHPREVPRPPFKARLLRLIEHKAAVCVDNDGRIFVLPTALTGIRLRLPQRRLMTHGEDSATSLYSHMDLSCIPRIGPSPLRPIFGPCWNTSELILGDPVRLYEEVAILFAPAQSGLLVVQPESNTDAYHAIRTLGMLREMTAGRNGLRDRVKKAAPDLQSDLLHRQYKLRQELSYLRFLACKENVIDQENSHYYHDVPSRVDPDAREDQWFPHDSIIYEEDLYHEIRSRQEDLENVYEQPDVQRFPKQAIWNESQVSQMREKVKQVKNENSLLDEMIQGKKGEMDVLRAKISRCFYSYGDTSRPPVDVKLLESLNSVHVATLLNNLGLHAYVKTFNDENVEGYLLSGCDAEYLRDLGVRPAHAQKLLAVLKGKGPLGRSFAELIH